MNVSSGRDRDEVVRTVSLVSLGCPKNLVDSEKMLGLLAEAGLIPVSGEGEADAVVINTCGFLEASRLESIDEINLAAELKERGRLKRLVVAGCLVQRHRARLLDWCPQIDALVGVFDRDSIVDAVLKPDSAHRVNRDVVSDVPVYSSIAANATIAARRRGLAGKDAKGYFESDTARLRLTPRHYAYLRISEGCNQNCAFCTIPSIRGKMRSKPLKKIMAEARELFMDGAFELNLIGQDTTSYGQDLGSARELAGTPGLVKLLEGLDDLAQQAVGGAWLRLMYAYPSCFTDPMIDAIARLRSVVKYIDLPLQHINDGILDRMRRRTSRKLIECLLGKLRQRVPEMTIRTTFISGFPGETEAEHQELVQFVREFGFDAMGVFAYSPESGTPAAARHLNGQAVPTEVVDRRVDELMRTQQQTAFRRNRELAGRQLQVEVLIEGQAPCGSTQATIDNGSRRGPSVPINRFAGRTAGQAPQIDGLTYVRSRQPLVPGEVVRCRIIGHDDYDLIAEPVEDQEVTHSLPVLS